MWYTVFSPVYNIHVRYVRRAQIQEAFHAICAKSERHAQIPYMYKARGGGGGGGALRFFFDRGVPQPTMKWGSKEWTIRVKYRVLGTTELSGRVKNGV